MGLVVPSMSSTTLRTDANPGRLAGAARGRRSSSSLRRGGGVLIPAALSDRRRRRSCEEAHPGTRPALLQPETCGNGDAIVVIIVRADGLCGSAPSFLLSVDGGRWPARSCSPHASRTRWIPSGGGDRQIHTGGAFPVSQIQQACGSSLSHVCSNTSRSVLIRFARDRFKREPKLGQFQAEFKFLLTV